MSKDVMLVTPAPGMEVSREEFQRLLKIPMVVYKYTAIVTVTLNIGNQTLIAIEF